MLIPIRDFIWTGRLSREDTRRVGNQYLHTINCVAWVDRFYAVVNAAVTSVPRIKIEHVSKNRSDSSDFMQVPVITSPMITSPQAFGTMLRLPPLVVDAGKFMGWKIAPGDILRVVEDAGDAFTGELDFACRIFFGPGAF